jgi:tRNA (guanine-N7-)-methyltransferase
MRTELPDDWPKCDFANVNLPLYLDIGCGKGGFLLELVGRRHGNGVVGLSLGEDAYRAISRSMEDTTSQWLPENMNYLGLEIRPGVSQYAQARVEKRGLDGKLSFVGCNANVDLDRLLTLYHDAAESNADQCLAFVSIQFPDPHFKKAHEKRRVVTPELVKTLAKFMKKDDVVFLQSDIKDALEAMREKFADEDGMLYFYEIECEQDGDAEEEDYNMNNPLGVPTEREVSVLSKELPVYRTLFRRNNVDLH